MCIMQIREWIGKLSNELQEYHADIPWHIIRGMQNFVAHEYGKID